MDIKSLVRKEVASLSAYEPEDYSGVRIKIDAMENPYPLPEELREGLLHALAEVSLNRYPDPEAKRLKGALAGYLGVNAESLVLGNGSDELIAMITQTFGGSPGLVAYPVPTFSMYGIIARSMGQEVMELPLTDDFQIDFDGWLKLFSERRPKVIFISYPNNPTGNLFDPDKIRRLIEGCFSIVVVDEAYFSFSGESFIGKINELPNLAVLRTLSKVGMAGLKAWRTGGGQRHRARGEQGSPAVQHQLSLPGGGGVSAHKQGGGRFAGIKNYRRAGAAFLSAEWNRLRNGLAFEDEFYTLPGHRSVTDT